MDFTWVTTDDANAIQNSIVDAKGDLIAATANDTPARLAVGANGETLVADSSTSTGLRYTSNFAAGKNKIINGDFGIWQRGTSFSSYGYTADRFYWAFDGTGTRTLNRQTFTPGTAPVSGYEGQYFARYDQTTAGTGGTYAQIVQRLEDVRTFANQTVTLSFWAKADASRTITPYFYQDFGSGGSSGVNGSSASFNLTTSWVRYSATFSIASVSGKTIGTSSYLGLIIALPVNVVQAIDIWGVQLEAGSVATAFQTATGTIQGELAACRRYLPAIGVNAAGTSLGGYEAMGYTYSTNNNVYTVPFDVEARVAPTGITIPALSNFALYNASNSSSTPSAVTFNYGGINAGMILATGTSTANQPSRIAINGYILFTGCEL
jgi:hypothetical protein